jgi:hypothetical protein
MSGCARILGVRVTGGDSRDPLRQRMLNELQRRNYAPSTIRSYLGAVQQFAEYFHRSPELLGPAQLRRYQLYLLQEKKLEPTTVEVRISREEVIFDGVARSCYRQLTKRPPVWKGCAAFRMS